MSVEARDLDRREKENPTETAKYVDALFRLPLGTTYKWQKNEVEFKEAILNSRKRESKKLKEARAKTGQRGSGKYVPLTCCYVVYLKRFS